MEESTEKLLGERERVAAGIGGGGGEAGEGLSAGLMFRYPGHEGALNPGSLYSIFLRTSASEYPNEHNTVSRDTTG